MKAKTGQSLAMSEWHAVWEFQNAALNAGHAPAATRYMRPELLSNMLFSRDFPLGVEEAMVEDKVAVRKHEGPASPTRLCREWPR